MKYAGLPLIFLLLSAAACIKPSAVPPMPSPTAVWTFDTALVNGIPAGAETFSGNWSVRAEIGTSSRPNALCQTGTTAFPALVLSTGKYTDVTVQTRFKPLSGNTDRAAGIIFRLQDKDNYYVLRANALENNVNVYKYENGSRVLLKKGSAPVASGKWQELRVQVIGGGIRGFMDGKLVVEAEDDTFKTGRIGLWTKADSVTCFDDVKVWTSP